MILALEVVSLPVADDGRGQVRDLYLVTPDGAAARQQLLERGRAVSDISRSSFRPLHSGQATAVSPRTRRSNWAWQDEQR